MDVAAKVTSKDRVMLPKAVRDALGVEDGDEVVFRVEGKRAMLVKVPSFLDLAGTVSVPAAKRNVAWDQVIRRTKRARGRAPVTAFVDTNVLVRHLTGDPPDMAEAATEYLRAEGELLLTDVVVAETVYVLESFYEAPRDQVARALRSLVAFDSIVCVDPALLMRALEVYETERVDFAEANLIACAESTGVRRIVRSLDRSSEDRPTDRSVSYLT